MGLSAQGGAGGATTFLSSVAGAYAMQPYHALRESAPPEARETMDELRGYCVSLGGTEDVRSHRVVYGRGMIYRWFADIKPGRHCTVLKTTTGWRKPIRSTLVPHGGDTSHAKAMIREAFEAV